MPICSCRSFESGIWWNIENLILKFILVCFKSEHIEWKIQETLLRETTEILNIGHLYFFFPFVYIMGIYVKPIHCPTKQKGSNYAECRTEKNDYNSNFLQLLYKRLPFFSKTTHIWDKMFKGCFECHENDNNNCLTKNAVTAFLLCWAVQLKQTYVERKTEKGRLELYGGNSLKDVVLGCSLTPPETAVFWMCQISLSLFKKLITAPPPFLCTAFDRAFFCAI